MRLPIVLKYKLIFLGCLCVCCTVCFSQAYIKGNIKDSTSKTSLGFATISVYRASDTVLLSYRLSTPDGNFKVPNIPFNQECRVIISYSGYDVYRKVFVVANSTQQFLDLGIIYLNKNIKELDEILVAAELPPVIVKKDTIEFNTSSFKTLPNSLVEDLLKKLPGVEVDKDGSISVHGKIVNRIVVDGKSFFGNDPKMATRNLPANIIDRVQVMDDVEEINRNIDGDLTNVGKVINLKLKKGVKKGAFGKAYAGAGTKDRFGAGTIVNSFKDTLQLSILGFINNINRSGFSMKDVQDLGGFNRSGFQSFNSGKRGGNQGFNINGIAFGGLEAGLAKNGGAGFNLNHAPSTKLNFYLQYLVGFTTNNIDEINNTRQFLEDTIIDSRTSSLNNRKYFIHNVNAGASIKPNPFKDLIVKLSYANSTLRNNILSSITNESNVHNTLSRADGSQINGTENNIYSHTISYSKRYKSKPGRILNISQSLNYKSIFYKTINESVNYYFYPNIDTLLFDLYRRQNYPTLIANGAVNIAEPLSKKLTLRWNNSGDYIQESQGINSYNKDANGKYTALIPEQNSLLKRYQYRFSSLISIAIKTKKSQWALGINNLIQNEVIKFPGKVSRERFRYDPLPTLSFIRGSLSVRFNQEVVLPVFNYLQTIPEQANLVYIRKGNIDLTPSRKSNLSANYFKYVPKKRTTISAGIFGTHTEDEIILTRSVDDKGVQTIIPANNGHSYFVSSNLGYSREVQKSRNLIATFSAISFINFESKQAVLNLNTATQTLWQFVPRVSARLNWKDIIEVRNEYSLNLENVTYSSSNFMDLRNSTHNFESEIVVRWPKNIVFESNIFYRKNNMVAEGLPPENLLWNAAVNLIFLRERKGQLRLSVYDILNRNNSYSRFLSQNYITDIQTIILKRYAILTFTYNFNNLGANRKVGGKESLFLF
jgi:uncharacterized protein Veg